MKGTNDKRLVPELRFPEFEKDGEWHIEKLCNIANTFSGGTPSVNNRDYYNGVIPFIRSGEINNTITELSLTHLGVEKSSAKIVEKGTILYALYGATSGEVAISKIRGAINQAILAVIPNANYSTRYVYQFLKKEKTVITNHFLQGGQGNLSGTIINNLSIPFPSYIEQQKIAECLSSIDEEINAIKEKVEQLKIHKKGLMQKLFPIAGKFVPELRFPEFKKDWDVDSMQSMFDMKNGYTPSKSNTTYWDKGTIPWFRMEDIRKNGHILSDSIQHVTMQAVKNSGLFPAYSIIVATTATIGEHALVIVDSLANQQFTFLTKRKSFKDKINMMYFHHYMFIIDEWCKKNTNSGGLVSVNMPAFKQLLIPFPSPAEQQKIADSLSSIDELISLYENKVILLEQHKKGLMQQLFPKL